MGLEEVKESILAVAKFVHECLCVHDYRADIRDDQLVYTCMNCGREVKVDD